ncbi:hypothetical protein ACDA63_14400 [Uliginosibacterium sp. sgz301328]|uniref:hypothetical protein n=1 Tax=Uliginosibacterium sp. sgz301328 TaxID=3243764 RepID=UPI00359E6280
MSQQKATSRQILIEGIPEDSNVRLLAWWYCGLKKNPAAPSEPKVEVCFRPILKDGSYRSYVYYDVGLTNLGQVRLGTIWHRQKKVGQIPLEEETFQLDFSDDGWRISGPWDQSAKSIDPSWLVSKDYLLPEKERHPKTRVVQFHLSSNPRGLVIPCMEVFSRLYGRSQYLKRILVTQPFDAAVGSLIVPDIEEAPEGVWQVTVDKHCVNGDGILLAHLKHDETTKRRVRQIWAQGEATQDVFGSKHIFPGIGPWFAGPAQLRVKGIWLDPEKRRFLALQINGCSDPGGAEIYLDRANTNITGSLKDVRGGTAWPQVREVKPQGNADILITHIQEPSGGHAAEEIEDDTFVILGAPRKIKRVQRESTVVRDKPKPIVKPPTTTVSGGAIFGGPQGVAPASITAPETSAIDSELMATWNALQSMAQDSSSPIQEVAAVTANGDLVFTEPAIIGFPNPESNDSGLSDSAKAWVYLDHKTKTQVRGILLLQVTTQTGIGYIMEIQKRPSRTHDDRVQSSGAYQYLAFSMDANSIFLRAWIATLLRATANALGVVSKATKDCPGPFLPFNHQNESRGGIPASILNGLKGIGLIPIQ